MRLYEPFGYSDVKTNITSMLFIKKIFECNLLEENLTNITDKL